MLNALTTMHRQRKAFVDLRFVDNLQKSGFIAKLYGTDAVSKK